MTPLRQVNQVVCCITCAAIEAARAATTAGMAGPAPVDDEALTQALWNRAWNVSIPAEENEMFDHASANPNHIMIKTFDFGYSVNGV